MLKGWLVGKERYTVAADGSHMTWLYGQCQFKDRLVLDIETSYSNSIRIGMSSTWE